MSSIADRPSLGLATFPVPDPASIDAEPVTQTDVMEADPAQVALTINLYAKVLVEFELGDMVDQAASVC